MVVFPGWFVFYQFEMDFLVDTSSSFSFKGNWSSSYLSILYFISFFFLKRQNLEPSPQDIDIYSTFDFCFSSFIFVMYYLIFMSSLYLFSSPFPLVLGGFGIVLSLPSPFLLSLVLLSF